MQYCPGLKPRRSKYYKPVWTSVFVAVLLCVFGGFYFATAQVDYIWHWPKMLGYFINFHDVEIKAEIDGDVAAINKDGNKTVVTVKGTDASEDYAMPAGAVLVDTGDMITVGDTLGSYSDWEFGLFFQGLWLTLYISLVGILFGVTLGLIAGLCRLSENPALRYMAMVYIELIRGTPLLVQIFLWYFVLGTLINNLLTTYNLPSISEIWYGMASLAFFAGAYVAEIVRSGIESIHPGQMEAARSLGMNGYEAMRHIILPQAFRRILPPLAGQFISLIKDSSLLGIIAIRELSKATREITTGALMPFEPWFICAILYLMLTFSLSLVVQWLERRTVLT